MCVWCIRMWWRGWMQRPVEDTGVLAVILGLICLRWRLTDYGVRLVASKPQRSSCFHLTVCEALFILLIFIYVSVCVCLLVCVCASSTPLEPSSLGSDTCRKKRVAGRTDSTRVCPCCWLRNPKGEMTPAQQQRETGQFHGLESHRDIHLRYKRLLSHPHETIQELKFPIRKK